eukprot:30473-Eustigmatos_ZCMA.PRE.1
MQSVEASNGRHRACRQPYPPSVPTIPLPDSQAESPPVRPFLPPAAPPNVCSACSRRRPGPSSPFARRVQSRVHTALQGTQAASDVAAT